MSLPDPSKSWAVLIGVGAYSHPDLPDLGHVHAGAAALREVLIDDGVGGLLAENCILVPEDASVAEVGRELRRAAQRAEDLLLVYYAGHGLRGSSRHDLVLTVSGTDPAGAAFEGIAYNSVRGEIEQSRARSKVVIVDCCFAGRALGLPMAGTEQQIADEIAIDGVATLTSVPANADAIILDGEAYPAYTTRLLRLLRDGAADLGEVLTVADVKSRLFDACRRDGLRPPQARTDSQIDRRPLVRNNAYVPELLSPEEERRIREREDLVSESMELLADLEYPYVLRDIAELLHRVVEWAAFYVNDDGLKPAEGIDIRYPPSGRGRRHARYVAGDDQLGDATSTSDTNIVAPGRLLEVVDNVQDLLDGHTDEPVTLPMNARYAQYSASGWLQRELRWRLKDEMGEVPPSVVVHPVAGRKSTLGLLVVWLADADEDAVRFYQGTDESEKVRGVLEVVARRAGNAIDNARQYAREHQLAETLQRAMLPEEADVPGLDVWTYYAPNTDHAQVGGDWYDILQISTEEVGLVIGDVAGRDVEAAATMGQLRAVVRAYAFENPMPNMVLEKVDQLVAGMGIPRAASMVYAVLRRNNAGAHVIEYSRAGHLPPLLLRAGTVITLGDGRGALVGFGSRERITGTHELRPGDTLLFYTDGLIERRDRPLRQGIDVLMEAAEAIQAKDAAGVGEELLGRLADRPEDDVAIIVVCVPDPARDGDQQTHSPRWRRWTLLSEPSSVGRARHAVLRTCQAWGVDDPSTVELVVSELVTNAVVHTWGHIALRLYDTGEGVRIEVEDSNPAPPVVIRGSMDRLGGFGMQIVDRLADWGFRPSGTGKVVWAKLGANGS